MTKASGIPSSTARSTDGTESVGLSTIPKNVEEDVRKYRETDDGKRLVGWIITELEKARSARLAYDQNWRRNLRMYRTGGAQDFPAGTLTRKDTPDLLRRKGKRTVNRLRSFVRTEHSKFVSQEPSVSVVPASSEDSDFRAATAGEQVWQSISSSGFLDIHYSEAAWWKVITGNGFIKTYWDGTAKDPVSGELGVVRFGSVSPFHLFVPDLREVSIEEQPFVINAYTKSLDWARNRFSKELEGVTPGELQLNQRVSSAGTVVPETTSFPESVTVLEVWVKPGAHKLLPDGGLLHLVGQTLVGFTRKIPYQHGMYPYAHLSHLHTGGFYRDTSVDDLVDLQLEYNQIRTDISRSSRLMGRPQILAAKGSYVVAKHTNEIGLIIEYVPGMPPPSPMPMAELPMYVIQQQERVLADMEDISGQHEVSRGQAPGRGITAGTAIAYLQESDDQYLTPQYRSDEKTFEKIAKQALELFVQNVPMKRKIRNLGADRAFDTLMLSGADIRHGTDVRVEKGSSISSSQVARRAEIKEMFGMGLISAEQAVSMLELGGSERIKETIDVARSKAQRENIKMKNLTEAEILQSQDEAVMHGMENIPPEDMLALTRPALDELAKEKVELDEEPRAEELQGIVEDSLREIAPPVVEVDDFDVHEIHIEVHNQFRMSQEYEQLPEIVQLQFDRHVEMHEEMLREAKEKALLDQLLGLEGGEGQEPSQDASEEAPGEGAPQGPPEGASSETVPPQLPDL